MMPAATMDMPPAQPMGPIVSFCSSSAANSALHSGRLEKMTCDCAAGTLLWP